VNKDIDNSIIFVSNNFP